MNYPFLIFFPMKLKLSTLIHLFIPLAILSVSCITHNKPILISGFDTLHVWSVERAREWSKKLPWLRGSDFIPSSAINQLEMWQAETFDSITLDRELGWAEKTGLNCMRVYLHHLAWETDREGFKRRIGDYLSIADRHGIKTIFVIFDDCWNPVYHAGKQPDPKPGVHNSGWVRDPGELIFTNPALVSILEEYVKDLLKTYSSDTRIVAWDLYNEPGNSGYGNRSMPLLKEVFGWSREISPSQPVTCGIWNNSLKELNKFQALNSDIISYHNYSEPVNHQKMIDTLKLYNRPMICTEYMARKNNSLFSNIMPILKAQNIGAINWGLVSGKTNTIYAWDTPITDGSEPVLWFHDIFRKDGSPYMQEEIDLIKRLTADN
jgi:hypothetical protein